MNTRHRSRQVGNSYNRFPNRKWVKGVSITWSIAFIFIIFSAFSIHAEDINELQEKAILKTLSKEAFSRVESTLKELKPGAPLSSSGLKWKINAVQKRGQIVAVLATADGWIGALSGGASGAINQFGEIYSRTENKVYGQHFYGYTWLNINLVPRYKVNTEAEIITEQEYTALKEKKAEDIGWFWPPGSEKVKTYFKGLVIKEIQTLGFSEPDQTDLRISEKPLDNREFVNLYGTPEHFKEAEEKLKQLKEGTESIEAVRIMGGKLILNSAGKGFAIVGMKGFLNFSAKDSGRYATMTAKGLFSVWPFGYMEGDQEVPKLSLILKNGKVFKVVPYASKQETERYFTE